MGLAQGLTVVPMEGGGSSSSGLAFLVPVTVSGPLLVPGSHLASTPGVFLFVPAVLLRVLATT